MRIRLSALSTAVLDILAPGRFTSPIRRIRLAAISLCLLASLPINAQGAPVQITVTGTQEEIFFSSNPDTRLSRVNIGTAAANVLSLVSFTLLDDGIPIGGGAGIVSGYDLDAVFLDRDGLWFTFGDRVAIPNLSFTPGTVRPTTDPDLQPSAQPGSAIWHGGGRRY
jgi:hypothetical protein